MNTKLLLDGVRILLNIIYIPLMWWIIVSTLSNIHPTLAPVSILVLIVFTALFSDRAKGKI